MTQKLASIYGSSGLRLDKFLCQKFDISFALAQKLLREKKILVNNQKADGAYKILEGDQIQPFCQLEIRRDKLIVNRAITPDSRAIEQFWQNSLYEDEFLIAINKPSGLATQGGSGIDISVDMYAKSKNYHLLHRLDKDTSGILLLAKSSKIAEEFRDKFRNREIKKTYQALLCGKVVRKQMMIDIPLLKMQTKNGEKMLPNHEEGKEAISELHLVRAEQQVSLVKLLPITGRTHQLRVHCKEIGFPIVNDVKYGGLKTLIFRDNSASNSAAKVSNSRGQEQKFGQKSGRVGLEKNLAIKNQFWKSHAGRNLGRQRLCLHAKQIEIKNYFGKNLIITSPDPDFIEVFNSFGK